MSLSSHDTKEDEPKRAKTNSERGKAFCQRQAQHLQDLESAVAILKQEIQDKRYLRSVWEAKVLRSRHTRLGYLDKLVREYYATLRHGLRLNVFEHEDRQASRRVACGSDTESRTIHEFLLRIADPDMLVGDMRGSDKLVDQWGVYTASHAAYEGQLTDVLIHGTCETPVVHAKLKIRVRLSRCTFETMFPQALNDEAIVQRLIGTEVVYPASTVIHFSDEGRIVGQVLQVGFVAGLYAVLNQLNLVKRVLSSSRISSVCTIHSYPSSTSTGKMRNTSKHNFIADATKTDQHTCSLMRCPKLNQGLLDRFPAVYSVRVALSAQRDLSGTAQRSKLEPVHSQIHPS